MSQRTTYLRETKVQVKRVIDNLEQQYWRARWLAKNELSQSMKEYWDNEGNRLFHEIRTQRNKWNKML